MEAGQEGWIGQAGARALGAAVGDGARESETEAGRLNFSSSRQPLAGTAGSGGVLTW